MTTDILPPHDTAAEAALLGSIFIRPALIDKVAAVLVMDDFFAPWHREVFAAMLLGTIDPVLVAGRMRRGDPGALMKLAECVPTSEHAGHYAARVRECAALRRLLALSVEVQSIALGRNRRAYEIATDLIAAATAVARKLRPLKAVSNAKKEAG